ncbi:hypothetical protein FDP41_007596 [Naegleria fowleri]|uniref:Uncharacterized protein n=1 Tax=Naegleria fowleri TaxID=5763 RepID=A0A6A5C942_NAEFO|nr:uncharacterized protein FDP41_007596 [Naegleria fowleri]KAF0983681.1 hypothetical protein FDP41_007596 [Naegleria fowleri]
MRHSMRVEDFSKLSHSEIESKFSKQFQTKFFTDYLNQIKRSKLISMDNGSGKIVSFFTYSPGNDDVVHFAFVNEKNAMLNIDNKFNQAKQFKRCYFSYYGYYDGWGVYDTNVCKEGHEWFCDQFKSYIKVMGRGLFLAMMEFICLSNSAQFYMYEMRTSVSLQALCDQPHPMQKQALHIHHTLLKNPNSLLEKAFEHPLKDSHLWYRFLNSGYTIDVKTLENITFGKHLDCEHLQFFFDYCEKHGMKESVAVTATRSRVFSLLTEGKTFIELLHKNQVLSELF